MISHLSDFLRYSLYTDSQNPVTVVEEMLAIERYLDIERVRFGERLQVSVRVAPDVAREHIPSMLLQPLVEHVHREQGGMTATVRIPLVAAAACA